MVDSWLQFITVEVYRVNKHHGESGQGEGQRSHAQAFKCPFPLESHRTPNSPRNYVGNKVLPTRDIHLSLGVQGFYWVLVMQACSTCVGDPPQLPKFQTFRRLEFTMNHTASINYLDTDRAWLKITSMQLHSLDNQFQEFSSLGAQERTVIKTGSFLRMCSLSSPGLFS